MNNLCPISTDAKTTKTVKPCYPPIFSSKISKYLKVSEAYGTNIKMM
uniref:Uncharacterized protein n=1 Tax=viral metagenome TaxID=1070528 RepID=A0A6C0JSI8_9ZZZZ